MSRSLTSSIVTFGSAAAALGASTESSFIESADPVDMETKVAALIASYAARNTEAPQTNAWVMTHLHLAGGGDGHTFVLATEWANPSEATNPVSATGISPTAVALFFFMAATQASLPQYRTLAQERLSTLFDAPVSALTVTERQTIWSGASQGTPFMGAVVAQMTFLG